ncbi:nuclear pore complex protein Nup155 [Schistocerca americana]|uniref:nuclear pore complex protein Nup155 n=1 Tax=Schistocerca americana TaxID=7009 RepID=UPI001F4FF9E3|nr:nuclear pore complex protein Nup155 [Schistocerca americana]XP_046996561.1 nuclear pore complex protein Nup155 [Schistocerca americana]
MLSSAMDRAVPLDPFRSHVESLELAGRALDRALQKDNCFPSLIEVTQVAQGGTATVSGLTEMDYPSIEGLSSVKQIKSINKVPLPREVMEHFGHMQCNCMMGLFPEIGRAWLTIDSDIYVWTYEHGSDLAYFDGLGETIVSIGLVKPKPGVFQTFVRYLLILTTTVEIVVLGVTFTSNRDGPLGDLEEMHLLPEPVFALPTDGVTINTVSSTLSGRLFLGGRDGSLCEIVYKAEGSWFGKRCKKVNHSKSALSFLVPSFISGAFVEEDQIVQITVDNSRNILYTLTEKGSISVYDLGEDGESMSHIVTTSQSTLVQNAVNIVRTLDSNVFRHIVSISPIEARESLHVNLVAVTKAGVRLYFTTSPVTSLTVRPYALHLVHVRLPPGFAACALPQQPRNVNLAHYSRGTLILVSCPGGDRDVLWCLSSDAFPFHQYLAETQTVIPLDGVAWALAEVRPSHRYLDLPPSFYQQSAITPGAEYDSANSDGQLQQQQSDLGSFMDPPLVVRQHMEAPKKYVILTPQGAEILAKLRPVDVLRQLLTDGRGPETGAVRTFFREQREEQACATCLMLACLDSAQNAQIAEWATRAFFLYGGEPRVGGVSGGGGGGSAAGGGTGALSPPPNPLVDTVLTPASPRIASPASHTTHEAFNPGFVSTPIRGPIQQGPARDQNIGPSFLSPQSLPANVQDGNVGGVQFSAKHNGLYLYMSRLLRPIWNLRTVHLTTMDKKQFLCSTLSREDCAWLLGHIHALRAFLEKNAQFSVGYMQMNQQTNLASEVSGQDNYGTPVSRRPQLPVQQVQLQEKRSLDAFRVFIAHVCEVLGLWKVLCEHQFHIIADTLSKEHQTQLLNTTFQTLILIGHELCSVLINSLINSYLNDNASIDAISGRLRDICPHLYRNEDAACARAYEMLLSARNIQNKEEKDAKLHAALQLCLKVAPQVNLPLICQWFLGAQYYEGILDLCAVCAAKGDPKKLGEYFYKNGEPPGDEEGYRAYVERMECYKEITSVLGHLYNQSLLNPYAPRIPLKPGAGVPKDGNQASPAEAEKQMKKIIQQALSTKDELLHVAIYDWMLGKQLLEQLVTISEPSFERYLKHSAERNSDSNYINDLLWKFYEKNENHAEAAQILLKMATTPGSSLNLNQRIAYLARAVMCMRSDKVGCAPHLGIVLQELEDKIDVAHVQQQILDRISSLPRSARTEEAVEKLNSSLIGCTELYEDYAEPFGLWDCKLAIVHCAGHLDAYLIEAIWRKIIEAEILSCGSISPNDVMAVVMGKVKSLGQEYSASAICVPVGFLVKELELQCCRLRADPGKVHPVMISLGVSVLKLIQIYDTLISETDLVWYRSGNEFHLIEVVGSLLEDFVNNPQMVSVSERRITITRAADLMSKCLTFLYSKPNTQNLVDVLRFTQSKLNRLSNAL